MQASNWRLLHAFRNGCFNFSGSDQGGDNIQHWAQQLVPRVGALQQDTVSANFVGRLIRGAIDMGASRPRLLSAVHMNDALLRNPLGRVARVVLVNLFAAMENEFGDRSIGLRLASAARPSCFSDLGYIAACAPDMKSMVESTIYFQNFRQNIWQTHFNQASEPSRLTWVLPTDDDGHLDACIEFSVASYAHLYRHSLSANLSPLAVWFRHQPRFDANIYREFFGCPVYFGAEMTVLELDRNKLELPSPLSNPDLQKHVLEVFYQPVHLMEAGKNHAAYSFLYLASEMNKSPLKLERLAASFGLTERTLRRKLVEEGYPFRDFLDKVRRDLCDLYRTEARRSQSDIAELLGYSELSAFTRAHRRWYGKPPSDNR